MRKLAIFTALLAAATPAVADDSVADTVGFKAFSQHCLDAGDWKNDPALTAVSEDNLSSLERRAMRGRTGGEYRFFQVSNDPRVLIAFQWTEQSLGRNSSGQRVTGVGGRCVVFTHETAWGGVEAKFQELTGLDGRLTSRPDHELLMMIDYERGADASESNKPWSFVASKARDTVMYRAIM